jgi:hypothetical protein
MNYIRVIPRDLFNEAKLLKCLAQLSLLIHDGVNIRWNLTLNHDKPENGFEIDLDQANLWLFCQNLKLLLNEKQRIPLFTPYNSKEPYPLFTLDQNENFIDVLTTKGQLHPDFIKLLDQLTNTK